MKFEKINLCKRCGSCCKTIAIVSLTDERFNEMLVTYNKDKERYGKLWPDLKFLVDNCIRLSVEEALSRNLIMEKWLARKRDILFFRCQRLQDNNTCGIYATRPQVCKGFPWYDQELTLLDKNFLFYHEDCGYKVLCIDSVGKSESNFCSSIEYRGVFDEECTIQKENI